MRVKRPDKKNAESLIYAAHKDASTIARNIHECFRMLGEGVLLIQGHVATDHIEPIHALTYLDIETPRSLQLLHTYRKIRHNINYYGYVPRVEEIQDMVDFSRKCFETIYQHINRMMND